MKIDVTQEDISAGQTGDCEKCPIALAMQRALPGRVIHVGTAVAFVYPNPNSLSKRNARTYMLPRQASGFIRDFDNHWEVAPFSFELEDEL